MPISSVPIWEIGKSMRIIKLFDIKENKREMISIVGGGGKTTTVFKLANELRALDKRVLVTTTTAMYNPSKELYNSLVLLDKHQKIYKDWSKGTIIVLGRCISVENKLLGVDSNVLDELYNEKLFDYILVEADGSKKKPIKAPGSHEPVIPSQTSKTIGVIGMDSLEKSIDENNVHRAELFSQITNSRIGDLITKDIICRLVISKDGLFKGLPLNSKKYLLLNKADREEQIEQAKSIAYMIRKANTIIDGIIAGSMKNERLNMV